MSARVLVVDDIPANVKLLEARLSAEYFDVLTAANGAEALAISARAECDIILLDVMMPDMDGFEVCRRIKADDRLSAPVLMVSAEAADHDVAAGFAAGCDDFMPKPFRSRELLDRLDHLMLVAA